MEKAIIDFLDEQVRLDDNCKGDVVEAVKKWLHANDGTVKDKFEIIDNTGGEKAVNIV